VSGAVSKDPGGALVVGGAVGAGETVVGAGIVVVVVVVVVLETTVVVVLETTVVVVALTTVVVVVAERSVWARAGWTGVTAVSRTTNRIKLQIVAPTTNRIERTPSPPNTRGEIPGNGTDPARAVRKPARGERPRAGVVVGLAPTPVL
jgi:hypothetical protein